MAAFIETFEELYRYETVDVTTDSGDSYTGMVAEVDTENQTLILLEQENDTYLTINHPATVQRRSSRGPPSEKITLQPTTISSHPIAQRDYEYPAHAEYVAKINRRSGANTHPEIYKSPEGALHAITGHRAVWALQQAQVDKHQFTLLDIDPWEAATRFCFEYLPGPNNVLDDQIKNTSGYYTDLEAIAVIEALYSKWGQELTDIPPAKYTVDRLAIPLQDSINIWDTDTHLPRTRTALTAALDELPQSRLEGETLTLTKSPPAVQSVATAPIRIELTYLEPGQISLNIQPTAQASGDIFDEEVSADSMADILDHLEAGANTFETDLTDTIETVENVLEASQFSLIDTPEVNSKPIDEIDSTTSLYSASASLPGQPAASQSD